MADALRDYFDDKVPVRPGGGPHPRDAPPARTWQQAWNNLSRQLFVVRPNQLDRAKSFRNRFLQVVR